MKSIKYTFILSLLIIGFIPSINYGLNSDAISPDSTLQITDSLKAVSCVKQLYLDNRIPAFVFEEKQMYTEEELSKGVFTADHKSYHETKSGRKYVTFLKSIDTNEGSVYNTYTFLLLNGKLLLENAELNFSASVYRVQNWRDYLLKHQQVFIDVGMAKDEFLQMLTSKKAHYCDTLQVVDDSSESWYIFNNKVLKTIRIQQYTP